MLSGSGSRYTLLITLSLSYLFICLIKEDINGGMWVLQCCKDAPSSDGAPLPSLHETVPLRSAHFLLFPFPSLWIPNVVQRQLKLTQTQFRLSGCPRPQAADPSCGGFSDRVPSAGFSWFASSGSSPASHVRLITAFHFDTGITSVACV